MQNIVSLVNPSYNYPSPSPSSTRGKEMSHSERVSESLIEQISLMHNLQYLSPWNYAVALNVTPLRFALCSCCSEWHRPIYIVSQKKFLPFYKLSQIFYGTADSSLQIIFMIEFSWHKLNTISIKNFNQLIFGMHKTVFCSTYKR